MITQKRVWEGYVELFLSGESMIKGTLLQMIIFFFLYAGCHYSGIIAKGFFCFFSRKKSDKQCRRKEKKEEQRKLVKKDLYSHFLH